MPRPGTCDDDSRNQSVKASNRVVRSCMFGPCFFLGSTHGPMAAGNTVPPQEDCQLREQFNKKPELFRLGSRFRSTKRSLS